MTELNESQYASIAEQEFQSAVPASLRSASATAKRWTDLAFRTQQARLSQKSRGLHDELMGTAKADPAAPSAPAYHLWMADDLAASAQWEEALRACDRTLDCTAKADRLLPSLDLSRTARQRKAEVAAASGDADMAIATWRELWSSDKDAEQGVEGMLFAGLLAEEAGREDEAAELLAYIAADREDAAVVPAQLALRALSRMKAPKDQFAPSVVAKRGAMLSALVDRDQTRLDSLVSRTHFAVGVVGGHFRFEDAAMRERVLAELAIDGISEGGALLGSGDKRYLFLSGFEGELLRGRVGLVFTRAPRGWECSGIALSDPSGEWLERGKPVTIQKNQPLPFTLKAPWPARQNFMAGGLGQFTIKAAAVAAAGLFGGAVLAFAFSRSDCGFGTRGFYYNSGLSDTHQDEDAFAIDFTRYRKSVPFDNESGGTPVLAPAPGVVVTANGGRASGDSSGSNTVELAHADPATGDDDRFLSRYLHLAGRFMLSVSVGMPVIRGQRLGLMNDTGNSVLDHLHFSIHDQTVPFAGASRGASVRPSPMDGTVLGDGNSGRCVLSSNRERRPPPLDAAEFVRQTVPSTLQPFEQGAASVTMRNSGPTTWTPGYKLVSLANGWTVDEVALGQQVAEGDEVTVDITLVALSPGDFAFRWQMSRPFSGRFGQVTPPTTVSVRSPDDTNICEGLDQALAAAEVELTLWQDMLSTASPGQKPDIIDQIQRVQGEIAAIQAQKDSEGCP